jgi:hypothetical protein
VILSPIEQSIKEKIEKAGIPLKNWDINIYRGVLTGYNEAFIISGEKREEILSQCQTGKERQETDKIIRPILRGRDIKRYGYEFADLWLINTHNGIKEKGIKPIDIKDYPAIKHHLDQYWDKISTRADRGVTPYNLRNCAYMDDFNKQKIIYPDIMRMPATGTIDKYPYFFLDEGKFFVEATNFIMTGTKCDLIYLFLASDIGFFAFTKFYSGPQFDVTGFRYKKDYLNYLPIPKMSTSDISILQRQLPLIRFNYNEKAQTIIDDVFYVCLGFSNEERKYVSQYKTILQHLKK